MSRPLLFSALSPKKNNVIARERSLRPWQSQVTRRLLPEDCNDTFKTRNGSNRAVSLHLPCNKLFVKQVIRNDKIYPCQHLPS